ncbi:MAG: pyruvate, phosphate dikinase [Elusimicrobia bacterium HGW-Elusimicrobia-2]|nr:MAG: pyruvate, phosphate dikinase [Elusimicrobia bacterium HGW-Elusimicrobia-2]
MKRVYHFIGKNAEGNAKMKNELGGKGANLAEMASIGVPVPPGFTITTQTCLEYYEAGGMPKGLMDEVVKNLKLVETDQGLKLGDKDKPLLVSVRSGARVSMPGMMDTVLNLGLNDISVEGLANMSGNPRFAWDCYRRFIQMFGDVVMDVRPSKEEEDPFEVILSKIKKEKNAASDTDLGVEDLKKLVGEYKKLVKEKTGRDFPSDPMVQLEEAVKAVFSSWHNERANKYRQLNGIPDAWGTAVNVQTMVYGNMGDDSATGVAFTRDPATGLKRFFGEYLVNAQGEDVVAGIRTPQPINKAAKTDDSQISLEEKFPEVYKELVAIYQQLEKHYRDMQDIEFTIQKKRLYLLQTRNGKRTGFASVRIAFEMEEEGLINKKEALKRVDPYGLEQLLAPIFDSKDTSKAKEAGRYLAKGLNASPGAATGQVVFFADDAGKYPKSVLVRIETSPEDIGGMVVAQGILTARGGMTSHAAVVARGMGKPCVAGCGSLQISYKERQMKTGGKIIKEGDFISIDGSTGEIYAGQIPVNPSEVVQVFIKKTKDIKEAPAAKMFDELLKWADEVKKLGVRTNADTPQDSAVAIAFGAEGIGLTRTEHMFFGGDRILAVREMILADDVKGREKALAKLLPMQRSDFEGIFEVMNGLPVIIRLLDPPLHEFLPHEDKDQKEMADVMGISVDVVKSKVDSLHEFNPMLGHRGCRLGIIYPEITRMQARAIIEAACITQKKGIKVIPEIMVPLIGHVKEYVNQRDEIKKIADEVIKEQGVKLHYMIGTMIEVPRAALTADDVAKEAEFFSFGTNDLTQMTCGFSRDDAGKFLGDYVEKKIYAKDPFASLDQDGVGRIIKIAVDMGRASNPKLEIGICGEHGGDPDSVKFCHRVGMNYVSCSPYRVPLARLAAAQAVLEEGK